MGWIKNRILSEYKKHGRLDWAAIAETKIWSSLDKVVKERPSPNELYKKIACVLPINVCLDCGHFNCVGVTKKYRCAKCDSLNTTLCSSELTLRKHFFILDRGGVI